MNPSTLRLAPLFVAGFLCASCVSVGYSGNYVIDPIDACVVDSETGKPVEGANVVANWQLESGSLDGTRFKGQLAVRETTTDPSGCFHFDGFERANPSVDKLGIQDPQLIVFKPGYESLRYLSHYGMTGDNTPGAHRRSSANGRHFQLQPSHPELWGPERSFYFGLDIHLAEIFRDCEWPRIARLIVAMDAERKRLQAQYPGRWNGLPAIESIDGRGRNCPSSREYFKALAK